MGTPPAASICIIREVPERGSPETIVITPEPEPYFAAAAACAETFRGSASLFRGRLRHAYRVRPANDAPPSAREACSRQFQKPAPIDRDVRGARAQHQDKNVPRE